MNENEFFYRLSPDRVLAAVEQADLHPSAQCMPLNSLENRVYSIVLESGETVVAKFYRPGRWSPEQIFEEHSFLFELHEAEIEVCHPLRFADGSSLKEVEGIYFALWPLTGGREPYEFNEEELQIMGRMLARVHNTGAAGQAESRPVFNTERLILNSLEAIENSETIEPELFNELKEVSLEVKQIYDDLSVDIPVHRIHGDCHLGNLLKKPASNAPGSWAILDFDDFLTGPAVQDIWMLLQNQSRYQYDLNLFIDAYRQFREFDERWLDLIEPLRAMRFIYYAGWIAKRKDDPAFQNAFPHFGTETYWRSEIDDLRKQLHTINGPSAVTEPEEELTNKDFFWDWED